MTGYAYEVKFFEPNKFYLAETRPQTTVFPPHLSQLWEDSNHSFTAGSKLFFSQKTGTHKMKATLLHNEENEISQVKLSCVI